MPKLLGARQLTLPTYAAASVTTPPASNVALYAPNGAALLLKDSSGNNRAVGITPCVAATTANITLSGTQTIDGVAVVAEDWVLVKNQTTVADNGVYICKSGAWVRTPGWDTAIGVAASELVEVYSGTANGGTMFMTTFKSTYTLGTTAMYWYRMLAENGTIDKPYIKASTNGFRQTGDFRNCINNGVAQSTSGQVLMQGIYLFAGDVVTSASFTVGATAGAGLTHSWVALCDSARQVKAISADDTTAAWGANTTRTFTMGSAYTVPTSGWYYLALLIAGTTTPTFHGSTSSSGALAQEVAGINWFGKSSTTGLTTPSSVGTTYGAITNAVGWYYGWVS